MVKKWQTLSTLKSDDYRIFSIDTIERISPRNEVKQSFFTIKSNDWLNIIAITSNNEVVTIEQYRHGSNKVEIEIPGGIVDLKQEQPKIAALRELKEETGYSGSEAIEIGYVNPNPALFSNKCYTFLVPNATLIDKQNLEDTEDISVRLYSIKEIPELIKSGKIKHGLVIAAFYFYEHFRNNK